MEQVFKRGILLFLLLCIILIPSASFRDVSAASYMQPMTDANLKGIDVSHWNGPIDWMQVKSSGIAFAYVKATDGTNYTDSTFASNVKGARSANLPVGAYHYARPSAPFNQDQPKQEAAFFVSVMKNNGLSDFGDIMPVLDLEEPATPGTLTPDELAAWTRIFMDTMKSLTNRQVMLYSGAWFAQQYNDFGGKLSDLPVWIAAYTSYGYTQPPICGGWNQWVVWQYNDKGTIPGITGEVDLDAGPTSIDSLRGKSISGISAQLATDKNSYISANYARIITTVKDSSGMTAGNAAVTLSIQTPKGATTTITGKTNSSGTFVYNYFIPKRTAGTYNMSVQATFSTYQTSTSNIINVTR